MTKMAMIHLTSRTGYELSVVHCWWNRFTFPFQLHNEAHIPIQKCWIRKKRKETIWICWKANIQMARRFQWLFCTKTGSKSNYLADVFMWISESSCDTDKIVELCSTPSTGFKIFLHYVEIDDHTLYENTQNVWNGVKKKKMKTKQIDYFIESSKGIFEPMGLLSLFANWYWQ